MLQRNRLPLDDVTFPGGITWSVGMMLTFDTAGLMELGSETGNHTLTSLKMSSDLLIHHASS